jgi:hypothetical protein
MIKPINKNAVMIKHSNSFLAPKEKVRVMNYDSINCLYEVGKPMDKHGIWIPQELFEFEK